MSLLLFYQPAGAATVSPDLLGGAQIFAPSVQLAAGPQFRAADATDNGTGGTTVTATIVGTSIIAGDVIVLAATWRSDTATASPPAGLSWSEIHPETTNTGPSPSLKFQAWEAIAAGGESSFQVTLSESSKAVAGVIIFYDANGGTLVQDVDAADNSAGGAGGATTHSVATGTRASGDEFIAGFFANSNIPGITEDGDLTDDDVDSSTGDTNATRNRLTVAHLITASDTASKTHSYTLGGSFPGIIYVTAYHVPGDAGQTVAVALLGGIQLFAPAVVPGAISVEPAALGGAQSFAPQINLRISVGLLGPAVTFAPQLHQSVAVGRLGTAQLFDPTAAPGTVTVSPDLLGGTSTFSPSQIRQQVQAVLLGGATLPAPSIQQAVVFERLGGSLLFSPAVATGAATVTPERLGTTQVFDPTVAAGAVSVSVDLLGSAQSFAPQLDLSISVPLLGPAQSFAPQLNQQVRVDLLGPVQILDPTVAAGTVVVSVDLLGGAVVFDLAQITHQVHPELLGGVTLPAPQINQATALQLLGGSLLFTPDVNAAGVFVRPALLGGAAPFAPDVVPDQVVAVDALGGAQIFSPAVASGAILVEPELLGGSQVFAPDQVAQQVRTDLLGGATLPAPSVTQAVAFPLLGGSLVFAPAVAAGTTYVQPDPIGPAQTFDPGVAAGAVSVTPDLLSGSQIFTPQINQSVQVDALGPAILLAPTLSSIVTVQVTLLGGAVAIEPIVSSGVTFVAPDRLGPGQVFAPQLNQNVLPDLLGGVTIFNPEVAQAVLGIPRLGQGIGFAPQINQSVALDLLGGAILGDPQINRHIHLPLIGPANLFDPSLSQGPPVQTVQLPLLGGASALDPQIVPGVVAVLPGLLGGAVVFDPSLLNVIRPDLLGGAIVYDPAVRQPLILPTLGGAILYTPIIANDVHPAVTGGYSVGVRASGTAQVRQATSGGTATLQKVRRRGPL